MDPLGNPIIPKFIKIRIWSVTYRDFWGETLPQGATVADLYRKHPSYEFMKMHPYEKLERNSNEVLDPKTKYFSLSRMPSEKY